MRKLILFFGYGLISFGIAILVYFRLSGPGVPLTHDGPIHVVRMASYYLALQQGQLPPRLGPNMANGFGYPVFNYNYPLANVVAMGFIRMHVDYPTVYQLIVFLFIGLGIWGMSWWLNILSFLRRYILAGMILYAVNPFLITQVFVRGGIGEIAFIGVLPWVMWSLTSVLRKNHCTLLDLIVLGVLGGILALTHNVLAVFCLPVLMGYAVWISRSKLTRLSRLFIPLGLAFLLSAFFWIPALFEKNRVVIDDASITNEYERHFLSLHQLFFSSWSYGYSRPGPVDGMSFKISVAELILGIVAVCWILVRGRKEPKYIFYLLMVGCCFLLTTSISFPLWQWIPFGNYIQFPWRLLWFGHIGLLFIVLIWLREIKMSRWLLGAIIALCLIEALSIAKVSERTNRSAEEWLRAGETTSTMNENTPKTFHMNQAYQLKDSLFGDTLIWTATNSAQVSISYWDGTRRMYQITTPNDTVVVERTANFLGWETRVDGIQVVYETNDPWQAGLISYIIPAGTHQVVTRFTQNTSARRLGNGLSVIGVLLTVGGFGWSMKQKNTQ